MYEVLHVRRIGENGDMTHLKNVLAHNARENVDPESPPEWRNPDWKREGDDLHRRGMPSDKALAKRTALLDGLKRKPMKNASLAVEFNVSAGEGFTDWKNYFRAAEEFLWKRYGRENCISSAIHTDENTPHMHIVFVPITGSGTDRRYASSAFLGTRVDLARLHDDFWKEVGCKFGLERGEKGSRARHGDARDFNKKLRTLEADRDALAAEREAFEQEKQKEKAALLQDRAALERRKEELDRRQIRLDTCEKDVKKNCALLDNELKLSAKNKIYDTKYIHGLLVKIVAGITVKRFNTQQQKKRSSGNDYTR